jgi:hypothetical protein
MPSSLPDIEIGYSSLRLLKLFGLGVLMTSVSVAVAFNWLNSTNIDIFRMAVGYFGVAFFGFATCKSIWLLILSRKPVVFVRHDGIRDTRISDELIAWSSVEKISIWQAFRQKLVVLKVTQLVAERLIGTAPRRILSRANKAVGADGVIINTAGLTMDAETLFDTCRRYSAAAESGSPALGVDHPKA